MTVQKKCLFSAVFMVWALSGATGYAQPKVGNDSAKNARYTDIMRAQQCMDYTDMLFKANKQYRTENGSMGYFGHWQHKLSDQDAKKFLMKKGEGKTITQKKYVGLKHRESYRPSGWTYESLFGKNSTNFRASFFRRYASPRGAKPGTYNLSFVVMSDNDQVYVCLLGTEPSIFPSVRMNKQFIHARGNTMNNLKAKPVINKSYDQKALVHEGWSTVAAHYYRVLQPILRRHGAANKKIVLTGHSQGAVLAGYMAFLFAKNKKLASQHSHRLVTFAAPRYGTLSFLKRFRRVLKQNAPHMTVDSLETVGDVVPGSWAIGSLPVGKVWRGHPKDIGYKWVKSLAVKSHHWIAISSFHALKIISSRGTYTGPTAVVDTVTSSTSNVARGVKGKCPAGFRTTAVNCVATTCTNGFVLKNNRCVSRCPANSRHSSTGNHCITSKRAFKQSTKKVWVGNFKKPNAYRRACPAGSSFSHDLAGYSYCKVGACPRSHPTRKGNNCHTSCGPLSTDAFGNCVVKAKSLHTVPLQCPRGLRRKGPICVK